MWVADFNKWMTAIFKKLKIKILLSPKIKCDLLICKLGADRIKPKVKSYDHYCDASFKLLPFQEDVSDSTRLTMILKNFFMHSFPADEFEF